MIACAGLVSVAQVSIMEVEMASRILRRIIPLAFLLLIVAAALVYLNQIREPEDTTLSASGTVEALEVVVASEISGRVVEVLVHEGSSVEQGQVVIRLDDEILQAQLDRANAAHRTAQAALHTAQVNYDAIAIQAEMVRRRARLEEMPARDTAWQTSSPDDFDLPIWYFEKSEKIVSAESEVDAASEALELERAHLDALLQDPTAVDLVESERRLAEARTSFLIAEGVRERARLARDDEKLEDYADELYEAAEAELEAAQSEYEYVLSDKVSEDVLEARARVAVAQSRYDSAMDSLILMQTGDDAIEIQASEMSLAQADAALKQAETVLAQAQSEITLIELQLDKLILQAPASGVVATRNVEPGEVLPAGAVAVAIDQLDALKIIVYVPEDRYGQIELGGEAVVKVDSFPDDAFLGTVVRIAERAEFTPRNVQTDEGRRTTVFAVELALTDPSGRLKPGMPADVDFRA
jgi:HlyD family secretion protein